MKKTHSHSLMIAAFVLAQLAWLGLLSIWIYWYVSNYLILEKVGVSLDDQAIIEYPNVFAFVVGIIMIVGIAVAIFVIFRNLTVQMKLNRFYDNFIASVTHELKSPLASIQLYLETLKYKNVKEEKRKEFVNLMLQDSARLNRLITSILEVSRLEQKRIAYNYHIQDADIILSKLLSNSMEHFRVPLTSMQISGKTNAKCVIDEDSMQNVFDNLLGNAIKYSKSPVQIAVEFKSDEKNIIIYFSDNGIGIDKKNFKKIFLKFLRLDEENAPSVKGTGLGLYWAKEIIKLHGGKISVASEGLDKGSTFIIELPIYNTQKKFYLKSLLKSSKKKVTTEQ